MCKAADVQWQAGPYPGVELKILYRNPETGGVVVLRKFLAGTTVPAHVHPAANESVYVLEGNWIEDGQRHGPGTFFFVAKGQRHGPHVAEVDVVSLTLFDGPLTVV